MKKSLLFLAVVIALLTAAVAVYAEKPVSKPFTGNYYLNMEGLKNYGNNIIKIKKISDKAVEGEVGIDWGIGPQARDPANWEKYYVIPFRAEKIHEGRAFRFRVNIAERKVYQFTLFMVVDREYREKLAGFSEIYNYKNAEEAPEGVYGVLAEHVISEQK